MNESTRPSQRRIYFFLILTTLFWGGSFLFTKIGLREIPPSLFVFSRFTLATIIMLVVFARRLTSFNRGILLRGVIVGIALGLIASGLIVLFLASVNQLIPLYAIGVFVSFTLSQGGMAHRWWKVWHVALYNSLPALERAHVLRRQCEPFTFSTFTGESVVPVSFDPDGVISFDTVNSRR